MPFNWPDDNLTVKEKIGVGTDTPSERLEVKGNIKLNAGVAVGEFSNDATLAVASDQSVPTTQAVKTYIDNQLLSMSAALAIKADKNGSLGEDFQADNLNAQGSLQVTGTITASRFVGDGSSLTGLSGTTQWTNGVNSSIFYTGGNIGLGTSTPGFALDVGNRARVRQGNSPSAGIWFYQTTPASDRGFVGMASDSQVGFWGNTGANWGLVMDTTSGQVDISKTLKCNGDLLIPNSGGGNAVLTAGKYSNESSFKKNNVKLSLGSQGIFTIGTSPSEYEFMIGNTFTSIRTGGIAGGFSGLSTSFTKRFSIDQNGNLYCAGSKAGFVTDYFINRVGDALEQGDVVVISPQPVEYYSGSQNNIPILEADLTEKAYDTRVCGIVARFVTEHDLPHVEPEIIDLPAGITPEMLAEAEQSSEPYVHPFQRFAASSQTEENKVQDQQMGMMVTLGAFSFCKVDADIAPILAGDLLTTSPTKGHAQKVLEPKKAVGAIVGKALASLDKGQSKIPVLVMLQ